MGFPRQEHWSGLPFPSPGDPPDPGIKPESPTSQADALTSEPPGKPQLYSTAIQLYTYMYKYIWAFPMVSNKEPACDPGVAGDTGSIPGLRRSPGGGHGNLLQYTCLENPMDRGAWQATVYKVSQRVEHDWSNLAHTCHTHTHTHRDIYIYMLFSDDFFLYVVT